MDIVIDERDFEEEFCNMGTSFIELDITVENPTYLFGSVRKNKRCNYYQEIHKEGELFVCFTSVLVRMYVNYVLNCLLELDQTLEDEKILLEQVYTFASDIMYEFFLTQIIFFYEFFNLCCSKDFNIGCCYGFSKQKTH